ncbi:uncharacterized protein KQ657_003455 [Scheffersomyces spartinae]|uniref:Thioesterase domain-containing protein n=1 Tax=Scheffersomyces spartinae TaxID=45513 RepID=A0A9P8AGC3_9ASCO|nr:uncharacterized protein KQ657_003455 [Scheffersomyces spartinae]KAG7191411.1 hypothetical protein KQ657_003455 [Scheffersomyces spartinae]
MTADSTFQPNFESSRVFRHYSTKYKTRSYTTDEFVKEKVGCPLTSETLAGSSTIGYRSLTMYFIDPYHFEYHPIIEEDYINDNYSITFFRLGDGLLGHDGIVHGGLSATLLDELTCRLAFQNYKLKKAVTANLNINYRQPVITNTFVLVKCRLLRKEGRKCWVQGTVYRINLDEDPEFVESKENILIEAEVLVIEPKWVHQLQNQV